MSGVERGSAEGEIAVAEDPAHLEPLTAVESAEDEVDGEELGERRPKIGRRPYTPTEAEVGEHNPLFVHYRTWCPHCVAGRSISRQHRRQAAYEESMGITLSVDYAFKIAEEADEKTAPILIAYEHKTGSIWAIEVDHKGADAGTASDWIVDRLQAEGYGGVKVTLKSDNEASILALKTAIAVKREAETAMIESPVRESKPNGNVERAVRN